MRFPSARLLCTGDQEYVKIPKSLFRNSASKLIGDMARPPSRRHQGTALRASEKIFYPAEMLPELLSTENGLPETSPAAGISRDEDGVLLPTKSKPLSDTYKIKLQDPAHIGGLASFETRFPMRGLGACKLLLSAAAEKRGKKAYKMMMLSAPTLVTATAPKGEAALSKVPTLSLKSNLSMMDENADVTFGVKTGSYPAWVSARTHTRRTHTQRSAILSPTSREPDS